MGIETRRVRLLAGFVASCGVVLAVLFGVTRLALGGVSSASSPPLAGSLDPSFGIGGAATHDLGSGEYPVLGGIAVQPDGKIVVAGGTVPGDHGLLLARYLPDGSLDPSFGNGGYVETHFTYPAVANAIALQPDGKIVVAGSSFPPDAPLGEFTLARYNSDGSLDTSFGADGITYTRIQPDTASAQATSLAVLPGGDVLVAGSVSSPPYAESFVLARYTSSGVLDSTFGDAGIVQTSFPGVGPAGLAGIAVQRDGKIVATGTVSGGHGGQYVATMALARYQPDGSLDPSFGTAGRVTTSQRLAYYGGPPALWHGKIVVAGWANRDSGSSIFPVIARYTANGRLDSTFGRHGFAEIRRFPGISNAVLAQNDGKILIAVWYDSHYYSQGGGVVFVVRLLPNGRVDASFGSGGMVPFSGEVSSLALQPDAKILVGGGSGNAWTLARLIGGNNCLVPGLRGETISKASAKLKKSYCRRGHISTRFSSNVSRGRVISTEPPRGTQLPSGARIALVISKGKRP